MPADKDDNAYIWKEGTEEVIKASYFFPANWPARDKWNIVLQVKQDGTGGPTIEIDANDNRLRVIRAGY